MAVSSEYHVNLIDLRIRYPAKKIMLENCDKLEFMDDTRLLCLGKDKVYEIDIRRLTVSRRLNVMDIVDFKIVGDNLFCIKRHNSEYDLLRIGSKNFESFLSKKCGGKSLICKSDQERCIAVGGKNMAEFFYDDKIKPVEFNDIGTINNGITDKNGNIFLSTQNGVYRYNHQF